MFADRMRVIDISRPVSRKTELFCDGPAFETTTAVLSPELQPGDREPEGTGEMSFGPEDAPVETDRSLTPFVGPALLLDISPVQGGEITAHHLIERMQPVVEAAREEEARFGSSFVLPSRMIVKTQRDLSERTKYPYFSLDAVAYLYAQAIVLLGVDIPSLEPADSESLLVQDFMKEHGISWLLGLDLTRVSGTGAYFLVAPPLKSQDSQSGPARAILLAESW